MHRITRYRPSPAMVVAAIALLVALGGTGYAAIALPANSVGTVQLKNGAVTAAKVKPGSLLKSNFAAGQLGPLAYAHVNSDGTLDSANSKNVAIIPTKPNGDDKAGGYYCLDVTTNQAPKVAVATLDLPGSASFTAVVEMSPQGIATWCDGNADAVVLTESPALGNRPRSFYIVFD